MISVKSAIDERFPGFTERQPLVGKGLLSALRILCHEREFKQFEESYPHVEGVDFVEQVLEYFDFSYRMKDSEKIRIPTHGRVVIVANHPIGSLDGLALLKMVNDIRPDAKAVANEILYALKPLRSLLLPVDNVTNNSAKQQIKDIRQHLDKEGALIIFPAGEVSRMGPTGIKDCQWSSGFLRFANYAKAPILPVYVDGRNSIFFYSLSFFAKPLSALWLIREMFKQTNKHVDVSVGHLVYPEQHNNLAIKPNAVAKLFKKQVYRLPKKGQSKFDFAADFQAIAHPEDRQRLRKEILACEFLGYTADRKGIYLYQYQANSSLMREIARLREMTFRVVKEGTGKRRDTDAYDHYYDHLVLWDDHDIEIVGAYRMAPGKRAIDEGSHNPKLYSQTLFKFTPSFDPYLKAGLELGRSFVQPKYWGKRSLDYLWQGIGVYLKSYPQIRYLFGPVSISHAYTDESKALLIEYYRMHYGHHNKPMAYALNPYEASPEIHAYCHNFFTKTDYQEDFRLLKKEMKNRGFNIPTLFKQYTDFYQLGGAKFLAFNIDENFSECIDGLILADLSTIKDDRKKRYLNHENYSPCWEKPSI